jgi:hypothetical protein
MPDSEDVQKDLDAYGRLVDLWAQENPIKTNKLQVLLAVNGLLVTGLQINGGFLAKNWAFYVAGAVFSAIWTFSIGRTVLFQKVWQRKIGAIKARHPGDPRFTILDTDAEEREIGGVARVFGSISSKYYLLLSPAIFTLTWVVALLLTVVHSGS